MALSLWPILLLPFTSYYPHTILQYVTHVYDTRYYGTVIIHTGTTTLWCILYDILWHIFYSFTQFFCVSHDTETYIHIMTCTTAHILLKYYTKTFLLNNGTFYQHTTLRHIFYNMLGHILYDILYILICLWHTVLNYTVLYYTIF